MRNIPNKILQIGLLSFVFVATLIGQEESETLISDTITVVKDFKINVEERGPYHVRQEAKSATPKGQTVQNISNLEEIDIEYQDPPLTIKPIRYTKRLEKKGNDGLIKVGYGTPRAIDAKLLYTYHIEDWYQLGLKGGYSSANNVSVENMEYTDWQLGLMGGYWLTPNFKVSLDTDFNRQNQGMYGQSFGQKPILSDRTIQTIENRLGFNLSKYESIGLQVDGVVAYDAAEVIDETNQQNEIYGQVHFAKTIWNGIALDVVADGQTLSSKEQETLSSFSINPALRYIQDRMSIEAGIHYLQYSGSPIIWPRINAQYALLDQPISFQILSSLNTETNSILNVTNENPFISLESGELASSLYKDRKIGFNLNYAPEKHSIKPYFVYRIQNDRLNYLREDITFQATTRERIPSFIFGVSGKFNPNAILDIGLDGRYNLYPNNTIATVNYLPLIEVELTVNQNFISERLLLSQSLHFSERTIGDSPINPFTNQRFDSNIINLSASINFKIFPNFWLYAEGDNLLFRDYEIWQGYAVFQPKAIFGIKYLIGQK